MYMCILHVCSLPCIKLGGMPTSYVHVHVHSLLMKANKFETTLSRDHWLIWAHNEFINKHDVYVQYVRQPQWLKTVCVHVHVHTVVVQCAVLYGCVCINIFCNRSLNELFGC